MPSRERRPATILRRMAVPKKRHSSHAPRQAPRHAQGGQAAPQRVPALPQPAPAAPRLPDLRHLRRARGDRASRSASRPTSRGLSADDNRRPRRPRRRPGPEAIVAGARAAAADGIRVRVFGDPEALAALDGVERRRGDRRRAGEITNDDEPVRRGALATPTPRWCCAAADVADGRLRRARQRRPDRGDDDRGAVRAAAPAGRPPPRARRAARRCPAATARHACCSTSAPTPRRAPGDLVQFAYLGSAFSQAVLGVERPRVAPAVGRRGAEEGHPGRGRGARGARRRSEAIDFRGNVEGRDLLGRRGRRDRHRRLHRQRRAEDDRGHGERGRRGGRARPRARTPSPRLGGLLLRPALGGLRRELDPDSTGGAILLGLRGVAVVAHGSSGPDGIANAIRLAARAVEQRAVERTAELLERSGATRARAA